MQAIHAQLGGRDALLVATFARFSPMAGIAAVLASPPPTLCEAAGEIYLAVFDAVLDTPAIPELLIEAAARPGSELAHFVRVDYAESVTRLVRRWMEGHLREGTIRPISQRLLLVLFAGPVAAEVLSQAAARNSPSAADRRRMATELAQSFYLAVRS